MKGSRSPMGGVSHGLPQGLGTASEVLFRQNVLIFLVVVLIGLHLLFFYTQPSSLGRAATAGVGSLDVEDAVVKQLQERQRLGAAAAAAAAGQVLTAGGDDGATAAQAERGGALESSRAGVGAASGGERPSAFARSQEASTQRDAASASEGASGQADGAPSEEMRPQDRDPSAARGLWKFNPSGDPLPNLEMPPLAPLSDQCIAAELTRAEDSYQRNLKRRGAYVPEAETVAEIVNKVLVPVYPCALEQRLGQGGEGGKWICRLYTGVNEVERAPSVASIGSRGQTTFEQDVNAVFGVVPNTMDPFLAPAVRRKVEKIPFLRLFNWGLTAAKDLAADHEGRMVDIPGMLKLMKTDKIDIFKIDCDGCENDVIPDMAASGPGNQAFRQMAIEVHNFEGEWRHKLLKLLRGIEAAGFRLFHAEENAYCYRACSELGFVHESAVRPPAPLRLGAEEDAQCMDSLARNAEAVWEANWARKAWAFKRDSVPMGMKWQDVLSVMLVADYPCGQQERFGVWDQGGVWVCLRHRAQCPGGRTAPRASTEAGEVVVVSVGGEGGTAGSTKLRFEEELVSIVGGRVHVFNPFLAPELRPSGASVAFHEESVCRDKDVGRLSSRTGQKHISVEDMMRVVEAPRVYLLRINCANLCEYGIVEDLERLYTAATAPFGQIALTLHRERRSMWLLMALKHLGYRLFHSEEVGYDEVTFELAFIHESCV